MTEPIQMQGGNVRNKVNAMNAPHAQMTNPVPKMGSMMEPPADVAEKLGLSSSSQSGKKVLTAEDLLADADIAQECDIDGLGVVMIKPISLGTSLNIQKASKGDLSKQSVWMIQQSLVEPRLSPEQINKIPVGKMSKIVEAINKVSGLDDDQENVLENF